MLKNLKALVGLAARVDASTEELLPAVPQAEAELDAARAARAEAEREYRAGLLGADEATLRRLADARRDAEVRIDRATALLAALRDRLAAAQEADRKADVDRLHAEADAAAEAYQSAVVTDLPLVIEAVRGMLRLGAQAETARQAAMGADPSRAPRAPIDAFRASPGRPRRQLSTAEEIELWCHPNGEPLAEALQNTVVRLADGSGFLRHGNSSTRYTHRRWFRRMQVLDAQFGQAAEPLAKTLAVPGVTALAKPGWRPMETPMPGTVLAALADLERQVEPDVDTRQPRMVLEPIRDLVEVGRPTAVQAELAGRRAS